MDGGLDEVKAALTRAFLFSWQVIPHLNTLNDGVGQGRFADTNDVAPCQGCWTRSTV